MARVLCDCTVWYRLANGDFLEKVKGHYLIGTYINFEELATSWYVPNRIAYAQQVIRAVRKHYFNIIPENPFDYMLMKIVDDFQPNYKLFDRYKEGHARLLSIDVNHVPPAEAVQKMENYIGLVEAEYQQYADCINKKMDQFKIEYESLPDKAGFWNTRTLGNSKDLITAELNRYSGIGLSADQIPWNFFELAERTFDAYMRKLEEMIKLPVIMKSRKNDFQDIFNLVYVRRGERYFTQDGENGGGVIDLIKRAGMGDYLF